MIMWIAALVLVVLCGVVGYRSGAIRAAITFVGLVAAAILALPMAPMFTWVFPLIGFKNPLAATFGAPIIAFVVASLVFKAIAAFVHRKVEYHYRYQRQDAERAVWEVMHRRVGACVGALNGAVYFTVFAIIVTVFGYYTLQTGAAESSSKVLSFLGKAAADLQETKMDKVVAPFVPVNEKYLDGSDVAGIIHHNRSLVPRLYNYPVFAAWAEEPAFAPLGADKDLQSMIRGQTPLNEILSHPPLATVISNTDISTRVVNLDFKDLKNYLETGVSEKYSEEKLLGRWGYDLLGTLQLNKEADPNVTASTWFRMKNEFTERFSDSVFTAFYDNKAKFVLATNMDGRASPTIPVRVAVNRTNYNARWFTTNAMHSATGKWSGSAPNYFVTLGNKDGTATSEGTLKDGKLTFSFARRKLAFTRLPD
jgi:uncharacterized membrane protein required for colicin V production